MRLDPSSPPAPRKRAWVFAHSSWDLLPVASGPIALALLVTMHAASTSPAPRAWIVGAMAAYTFVFFVQVYAYHFHAHTPYLRWNLMNRALDVLYSAVNGEPHSFYTYQHLRHHDSTVLAKDLKYNRFGPLRGALSASGLINPLFYAQQLDCFRLYWVFALLWTGRDGEGQAPLDEGSRRRAPPARYSWHRRRGEILETFQPPTSPIVPPHVAEWAFLGRERGYMLVLVAEIAAIVGLRAALAMIAPRFFFLVYVPCSVLLFAVRSYTDFVDHYGADVTSRPHNSVSCYGSLFNLMTFNSGYHLEHHWSPGLHWTRYPQLRPKMVPEDERRVIPFHLWLNPFFPVRPPLTGARTSPSASSGTGGSPGSDPQGARSPRGSRYR